MDPLGRTALALVLVAAASPAVGQEPKKRPGRFKLGPLYLTPKLELKNAGVDTNVFNTRTGQVADTSIALSPSLEGTLGLGRRVTVTGKGHLDLNYFRQRGSERSVDFGGEGRGELDLGRLTLFGAGGGQQSKQRFSSEIDERLRRQEKWAGAGLDLEVTRKITLGLGGTGRVVTHESFTVGGEDLRDILDRNSLTGSLQARYALTRKTTFLASAEAIEERFLRQSGSTPRQVRSFRYLAGFELGPRALVRGRVLGGLREFPAAVSRGAPSYRGLALDVDASLGLRFGRLTGIAQRDVLYSVTGVRERDERLRNTFVFALYRGGVELELPFSLIGGGFAELQESRSLLPRLRGGFPVPRVDHLWVIGGSLLRRFGGGVRLGGTLAWTRRTSTFQELSFSRLVYGVQGQIAP